jgi:protoporphyrinogen/coproporphyrinogen III oxidase
LPKTKHIVIVGAGFSGLSLAYWATKRGISVDLIEKKERVGGLISSQRLDGQHLIESAANGFLFQPEFVELEKDLDIRFIPTQKQSRRRYIYRKKNCWGFFPFARWPLSFLETIGTLFCFVKSALKKTIQPRAFESIRSWGERVVGQAATRYLLEPALQGIYAGDPSRLSASLILGRFFRTSPRPRLARDLKGRVRRGTHTHPEGMGALMKDLRIFLEKQKSFRLKTNEEFSAHDLAVKQRENIPQVLTVPAPEAQKILRVSYPELAQQLGQVEMRELSSSTLIFEYKKGEKGMPKGFGILFPRSEGFEVMGVLRNHHIFENRSPQVSETWIYAGDASLSQILRERAQISGIELSPITHHSYHWPQALPHYTVELEAFLAGPERARLEQDKVYLFGNYTGQIGLARLFISAKEWVEQL